MAWWNTHWDMTSSKWVTRSAGKQPAWLNYMTNVNKTYGNFAIQDNEMFMTLNRRYGMIMEEPELTIDDLTTYIHPQKYNNIFAQTSIDAQNFWVQIGVDIEARRKLSAKVMPNLQDGEAEPNANKGDIPERRKLYKQKKLKKMYQYKNINQGVIKYNKSYVGERLEEKINNSEAQGDGNTQVLGTLAGIS